MQSGFRGKTLHAAVSKAVTHGTQRTGPSVEFKNWVGLDFVRHFYTGRGRTVTLRQIGLLQRVRQEANRLSIERSGGFKDQIRAEVRRVKEGPVRESFRQSYSFSDVRWAMGGGRLDGEFNGECLPVGGATRFTGIIEVQYSDTFEDILSLVQRFYGSSDSPRAPTWLRNLSNVRGTPFRIVGEWQEHVQGQVGL